MPPCLLRTPGLQAAVPGPQTLTRPCTAPAGSIVADKGLASPASSSLADISEQPVRKASYQQLSLEELEGAAARDTRPSRGLVDEAAASVDDLGTEETSRGVPVFVMMPLDTVRPSPAAQPPALVAKYAGNGAIPHVSCIKSGAQQTLLLWFLLFLDSPKLTPLHWCSVM